jgi:hypothetical protein
VTTAVPRLGADVLDDLDRRLAPADTDLAARYPGDAGTRQPVHTVYVPPATGPGSPTAPPATAGSGGASPGWST